jgi:phosphate-selective porin OprO/OprP
MKLAKHTRTAVFSAALLATVLPGATLQADPASDAAEIQALREQIVLLQKRLDAIEAREAAAQAKAPAPVPAAAPAPAAPAKSASDVATVKFNSKGFSLSTADGGFGFQIRPRLQTDFHFFPDAADGNNEFYVRRAILSMRGNIGDSVRWIVSPNFGGSSTVLDDAWIELSPTKNLTAYVGKIQIFEGLENIQSNAKLLFIERGTPYGLVPGREFGIKILGKAAQGLVSYGVSVTNDALDSTSANNSANTSGDLATGAYLFLTPATNNKESLLSGLGVGLAVSTAKSDTSIDTTNSDRSIKFKTGGRNTFLSIQNGVIVRGTHNRFNPQFYYYHGPLGILSEYVLSTSKMSRGGVDRDISNSAWTVQASWVVTGEDASFSGVKPSHPFVFGKGGWGAWELGARLNAFNADEDLFAGDAATKLTSSTSAQKLMAWGLVAKWYLTENLLWALNYERSDFSGLGANRSTEDVITTRLQIDF